MPPCWTPARGYAIVIPMKRRTIYLRRDDELSAFATRRGIDLSSAVNLLLGLALDSIVENVENPNQMTISDIKTRKEHR